MTTKRRRATRPAGRPAATVAAPITTIDSGRESGVNGGVPPQEQVATPAGRTTTASSEAQQVPNGPVRAKAGSEARTIVSAHAEDPPQKPQKPQQTATGSDEQGRESTGDSSTSQAPVPGTARPWQRFAAGGSRTGLGSVAAALLALGLGFAVMTQVRQNEKSGLDALSQSDLVALLATVNDQSSRLETELDELRDSKAKLDRGGDAAAVADAQKRLDDLRVLNGEVAVTGPGITIAVDSGSGEVTAANVLDAVQELRDAGAESIDVGGHRVIASTWFDDVDGAPAVRGQRLASRFTVSAIGDPHTMSTAMAIPGGVTDTLTQAGAKVKVTEEKAIRITSIAAKS